VLAFASLFAHVRSNTAPSASRMHTSLDGSDQLPSPPETGASISITAMNRTAISRVGRRLDEFFYEL
jgi:hypothetical protein